jgi:TM2 domain-containing membrane protein YozV
MHEEGSSTGGLKGNSMTDEYGGQTPPRRQDEANLVPMRAASHRELPPHPLDKEWWAHIGGKPYGPYSGHEIRRMVDEKRIGETDHVCPADGKAWVPAKNDPILGGLFSNRPSEKGVGGTVSANGGTIVQVTNQFPNPSRAALLIDGPANPKSPGVALLLSLLICGVGQMYNGQVAKGFLMLIGCFLLWFIFLGWVIWIWSMVDAYSTAKRITLRYQQLLMSGGI